MSLCPMLGETGVAIELRRSRAARLDGLKGWKMRAEKPSAAKRTVVPVFTCPTDPTPPVVTLYAEGPDEHAPGPALFDVARANYAGMFGTKEIKDDPSAGDGVLFQNSHVRFRHVTDGLSKTILVGERSSKLGHSLWAGVIPGAAENMARVVGSTDHAPNHAAGHFDDFSSHHFRGAHFVFADNHVALLNDLIELRVYQALATRAGGELVSEGD